MYNSDYFKMWAARKDACKYMPCVSTLLLMRTEQKVFGCVQYHRGKKFLICDDFVYCSSRKFKIQDIVTAKPSIAISFNGFAHKPENSSFKMC